MGVRPFFVTTVMNTKRITGWGFTQNAADEREFSKRKRLLAKGWTLVEKSEPFFRTLFPGFGLFFRVSDLKKQ